jgi:hypothetical protein
MNDKNTPTKDTTRSYQGILGLDTEEKGHGRLQAWGACLTIGQKDPRRGFPTDTDKFFIKKPTPTLKKIGGRNVLYRENDPTFSRYNGSDKYELRNVIRLSIVHWAHLRDGWDSMNDCFHYQLAAQQLPRHQSHPRSIPVCSGNGTTATRWVNQQFKEIECPNRLCQFRDGNPPPCKPIARLAFQLRWEEDKPWSDLPTPLTKFETRSWHNLSKIFIPFFKALHSQATQLGFKNYNFYNLPCILTLSKRTSQRGSAVPAISINTDFPRGITLLDFLIEQAQTQNMVDALVKPTLKNDPIITDTPGQQ